MSPGATPSGPLPPYSVHRAFLDEAACRRLLDKALGSEALFAASGVGGFGHNPEVRSSMSLAGEDWQEWFDLVGTRVRALVPELCLELRMKPFEVAGTELDVTCYNDGGFYRPHIDTVTGVRRGGSDRILSGVYYFHRSPRSFSGGALRLHPFGSSEGSSTDWIDVEPEHNSLVVFPSWARHEVRPVSCPSRRFEDSRFAINCWLHARR